MKQLYRLLVAIVLLLALPLGAQECEVTTASAAPAATASATTPNPHEELFRIVCGEPRAEKTNVDLGMFVAWTDDGTPLEQDVKGLQVIAYDGLLSLFGRCSGCGISWALEKTSKPNDYPDYPAQARRDFGQLCAATNIAELLVKDGRYFGGIPAEMKNARSCSRCGQSKLSNPELELGYGILGMWISRLQEMRNWDREIGTPSSPFAEPKSTFAAERPLGEPVDIRDALPKLRAIMAQIDPEQSKDASHADTMETILQFASSRILGRTVSKEGWTPVDGAAKVAVPIWCWPVRANTACVIDRKYDRSGPKLKTVYEGVLVDGTVVTYTATN